jgi:hypothetical protein
MKQNKNKDVNVKEGLFGMEQAGGGGQKEMGG